MNSKTCSYDPEAKEILRRINEVFMRQIERGAYDSVCVVCGKRDCTRHKGKKLSDVLGRAKVLAVDDEMIPNSTKEKQ